MPTSGNREIQGRWLKFLMDTELALNYKIVNMFVGHAQPSAPNPILEALLPSLLYVRLGALLDEALDEYIMENDLVMSRPYRSDFNGRITFLNGQGLLKDASRLQVLRKMRNQVAHEASRSCTWRELEDAIVIADMELQHLGLVDTRPKYEFYAQRNPREKPE